LLSSPEPDTPADFSSDASKRAMTLLNQISLAYKQLYFPEKEDRGKLTDDWRGSLKLRCACVTRDDFGPLATNLKLLLEKADGNAFPWGTNILDFLHLLRHGRILAAIQCSFAPTSNNG
jgi:hypothetical protein